ncbi:MAG: nitrate- and nitrite sensing domain-containing protein [Sulfuritalea sp.]|nr:nitrate- and nitrite sensing domain-containing protein [Sulfuritalea sp.]
MQPTSIIQRLILLVIVPLVAMAVLAAIPIQRAYSTYQSSNQTHQVLDIFALSGNLIHTLQIERGATAGFLKSQGKSFADVLPGMRKDTDVRLANLKNEIAAIHSSSLPTLVNALKDALNELEKISDIRERASLLTLTVADEVTYYSNTINRLIAAMSAGVEYNNKASITKRMFAYLSFVRAKENAGIERALVTTAFAANRVDPALYRSILNKIYHQDAYLHDFKSIAGAAEVASLETVLKGPAALEVERLRNLLITSSTAQDFGVAPAEWFKTITAKIDGLHATENLIKNNADKEAIELQHSSQQALIILLVGTAMAMVISIAISLRVARGISSPLRNLIRIAEESVSSSNFTIAAPESGPLEVARTGIAFNHLTQKFRDIIQDTKRSSDRITEAANTLSINSQKVKEGSLVQSAASESVAAAVEQASVSISETAANARNASDVVVRAQEDSEKTLAAMRETVSTINGVARLIAESGKKVEKLDESSQRIGNIVQVIRDIADQTNLLALNAAIEAARAGEQGRGFAVVADEVRKLAERTAVATGEIGALIGTIQENVGGTVIVMQQANTQVGESLERVDATEKALQRIDEGSREVSSNVNTISHALAEQDVAVRQIAVNVEQIAQMTEANNSAATENNQTASELDGLSQNLRNSVAAFKV